MKAVLSAGSEKLLMHMLLNPMSRMKVQMLKKHLPISLNENIRHFFDLNINYRLHCIRRNVLNSLAKNDSKEIQRISSIFSAFRLNMR